MKDRTFFKQTVKQLGKILPANSLCLVKVTTVSCHCAVLRESHYNDSGDCAAVFEELFFSTTNSDLTQERDYQFYQFQKSPSTLSDLFIQFMLL